MKKTILSIVLTLVSASAFAASHSRISANSRSTYLPECGGVISATERGEFVTVSFSNVKNCSNVSLPNGQEDKLRGPDSDRYGSFTFRSFGRTTSVTVSSNSGAHADEVVISMGGSEHGGSYKRCYDEAKEAATRKSPFLCTASAWATYNRTSNAGNYVYDVSVTSCFGGRHATLEVVARPGSCEVLSVQ